MVGSGAAGGTSCGAAATTPMATAPLLVPCEVTVAYSVSPTRYRFTPPASVTNNAVGVATLTRTGGGSGAPRLDDDTTTVRPG